MQKRGNMLYPEQKPISDKMYERLENKELHNIPTGRGKTYIFLDVARRCLEDGKKVIVSAPDNNLVKDMFKTATEHFKLREPKAEIVIGADNYISKRKLDFYKSERTTLKEYVTKESFERYYKFAKKQKGDLFFDDFEKIVDYKDTAYSHFLKRLLSVDDDERKSFDSSLSITNHFFLLSKVIYDKNFDISDYVVLIDEVHMIADVSEKILTESLSFFDFKIDILNLKNEIEKSDDFKGRATLLKKLKELYVTSSNMLKRYSNSDMVGQYDTKTEHSQKVISTTKSFIESDNMKYLLLKKDFFKEESRKVIEDFDAKKNKVSALEEENYKKFAGVHYSPSRGYPNVKFTKKNVLGQLNYNFWGKINFFAGGSASITSSFSPDINEKLYGYARLGMLEKDSEHSYNIWYYDRLFPKENVGIYLPEKELGIDVESVYDKDCDNDSPYYNYLVDYIYKNKKGKNALVLCGGYKESKFLANLYSLKYSNERVHYANTREKASHTIERFKEEGGVLFGTRNYNTGISLKGELLEELFILKFPFVNFTEKKWLDIKEKGVGLYKVQSEKEMLITLIQTLGRLQRAESDKGNIHLMDQRYNKYKNGNKLKEKIDDILNMYGVIIDSKPAPVKKEKEEVDLKALLEL